MRSNLCGQPGDSAGRPGWPRAGDRLGAPHLETQARRGHGLRSLPRAFDVANETHGNTNGSVWAGWWRTASEPSGLFWLIVGHLRCTLANAITLELFYCSRSNTCLREPMKSKLTFEPRKPLGVGAGCAARREGHDGFPKRPTLKVAYHCGNSRNPDTCNCRHQHGTNHTTSICLCSYTKLSSK